MITIEPVRTTLLLSTLAVLASGIVAAQEAEVLGDAAEICLGCHNDPIIDVVLESHHGDTNCEACHGPGSLHVGRSATPGRAPMIAYYPKSSDAGVIAMRNGQCLACHDEDSWLADWNGSQHGGIVCNECHAVHATSDPMSDLARQSQNCFGCHEDTRDAHPDFSRVGISSQRLQELKCWDCHDVHQLREAP